MEVERQRNIIELENDLTKQEAFAIECQVLQLFEKMRSYFQKKKMKEQSTRQELEKKVLDRGKPNLERPNLKGSGQEKSRRCFMKLRTEENRVL